MPSSTLLTIHPTRRKAGRRSPVKRGLALLAPLLGVSSALCGNLLRNPDFEQGPATGMPAGWQVLPQRNAAPPEWTFTADAHSGDRAILFNGEGQLEQYATVPNPGRYKLSAWIRKRSDRPLILGACFLNPSGWIIAASEKKGIGDGAPLVNWTEVSHVFDVPPGNLKIRVFINGRDGVLLDAFKLVETSPDGEGERIFMHVPGPDTFSNDWTVVSGTWETRDGALKGTGPNAFIRTREPVGGNIRAEYTCWTDRPCDLSAVAGHRVLPVETMNGYFFGFGSGDNTLNTITRMAPAGNNDRIETTRLARTMMEGFNTGIEPGRRHRIVIERKDGRLTLFRDGELDLAAEDLATGDVTGEHVGFYVHHEGFFSDLKIFRLPDGDRDPTAGEVPVTEQVWHGFDEPDRVAEGTLFSTTHIPNWGYAEDQSGFRTYDDPALALEPAGMETAVARLALPRTPTGIVEFDILIPQPGNETRVALEGQDGQALATLLVDADGRLFIDAPTGRRELLSHVEYRRRDNYQDAFRLLPNMWHTLRIKYDSEKHRILNTALLNLYTEDRTRHVRGDVDQGDYLTLGYSEGFASPLPAARLAFSTRGPGRVLLDNVTMFGPVGATSVNGKNIAHSARALLDLDYEVRRDPINLKLQSLRFFAGWPLPAFFHAYASGEGSRAFQDAGRDYDVQLVRQAFLREQIEHLERLAAYRRDPGRDDAGLAAATAAFRIRFAEAETRNEAALVALGAAFRDGASGARLEEAFRPALQDWAAAVEALRTDIGETLSALARETQAPEPEPMPLPMPDGAYAYDFERRLWTRGGMIEHYFHSWRAFRKWRENLLGFPAHWISRETFIFGNVIETGDYLDRTAIARATAFARSREKSQGPSQDAFFWMQNGTHHCLQPIPDWCHEQFARHDDDFYFWRQDGTPFPSIGGYRSKMMNTAPANFWNEQVRKIQKNRNLAIGRTLRENPVLGDPTLILMGGEALNMLQENQETGHNPSAILAFQRSLEDRYRSIDALNERWRADYAAFSDIRPPRTRTPPSPLQYEFQKFRQHDYFEQFITPGIRALEEGYGKALPVGHELQDTFGGPYFDMAEFFDRVPIVLFHTYKMWDRAIYPRWLNALSQATGTPWGAHEWVPAQGSKTLFDLEWLRRHALREVSHQILWRNAAPNKFDNDWGFPSNWQYGMPTGDYRLNNIVLSHSSTFWPVVKDRSLRFGTPALTADLVQPDVALLEITSSWLNEPPVTGLRNLMRQIAGELERMRFNYGYLYEKFLLDGRQDLTGIQTIIVPNGICAPGAIDARLEAFAREGGTVVAFAPPGLFDEYGHPRATNGFMQAVFPGAKWTHDAFATWDAGEAVAAGGNLFYAAAHGKGRVVVFRSILDWAPARATFAETVEAATTRTVGTDQPQFAFCLREDDTGRHLYVLNNDIEATRRGELFVQGDYRATDRGMQIPVEVRNTGSNGVSRFQMELAPAGMTRLELTPRVR